MNCSPRTLSRFLLLGSVTLVFGIGIAQADTMPFKATIEITEMVEPSKLPPPCPALALSGDITGKGNATRLGKITATSVDCIVPVKPGTFIAHSTQFVMTGANGD